VTNVQSFDLVRVPFPFTDRQQTKRRPAVVLSQPIFQQHSGHLLLAMVTSAQHSHWPSDWLIKDLQATGLTQPCVVRFKLFTLDQSLLLGALGRLSITDQSGVLRQLSAVAALSPAG